MHKGQKDQMHKHVMSLVMIQWICVSNIEQEWRLTMELKILEFYKIVFLLCKLMWFLQGIFFMSILCFGMHILQKKWLHSIMCALCENKILK